jgi:hypothetical protein
MRGAGVGSGAREGTLRATAKQCNQALDQYEQELGRRKNVVGLGIVPAEEDGESSGRQKMAVAVYVKKKLPEDRLAAKDVIPPTLEVRSGKRVVRVPTRVIEQGKVRLEEAAVQRA